MEYSLNKLNKKANTITLTVAEIIEKLNLIGFEIDNLIIEQSSFNSYSENVQIIVKIPANREDLLLEKNLLIEFSTIFLFKLYKFWEITKKTYFFLLKQKYFQHICYKEITIESNISSVLVYNIKLKNFDFCSSSPLWIQEKLQTLGVVPKKNYQDLISLVDSEWGQTFSLFSISKFLVNEKETFNFFLEKVESKTSFSDNDQNFYEIFPNTIIIKDKLNQLLTILGNKNELKEQKQKENKSKHIFIQGIFYNIYENPLLLNSLTNKISLRPLRKNFLENFKFSFQRLLTLFEIIYSISVDSTIYLKKDNRIKLKNNKILKLTFNSLLLLLNIKKENINLIIFKKAGLKIICKTKNECYFTIPNFRHDLEREIDLIEEYSRFIGYKNFTEIFPEKKLFFSKAKKKDENKRIIKQYFLNYSFTEILTNSLEDKRKKKTNSLILTNPLNNEFTILRTSLIPKIIEVFETNVKTNSQTKNFFEIGRVFLKKEKKIKEIEKISGIFQLEKKRKSKNSTAEWFLAKGLLENFCFSFGYDRIDTEVLPSSSLFFHPTKSILLKSNSIVLGVFGEINPIYDNKNSSKYSTYLFELNLNSFNFCKINSKIKSFTSFSRYPRIIKDFSFIISKEKNFSNLKKEIELICEYLKTFEFFDIYFDEKSLEKVTIGIRLIFQSNKKTLTNEIVEKESKKVRSFLIENFNAEFRD